MILADANWADYGALGLVVILLATWLTALGKWVVNRLVPLITECKEVIGECKEVIDANTRVNEQWQNHSSELTEALKRFHETAEECKRRIARGGG